MLRRVRSHRVEQFRPHAIARQPLHLLHVVLAVEQLRVDPRAARLEEPPRLLPHLVVAHDARHFLDGAERAEIVDAAERVRPVELDVVGVVLRALEHAVAIGVPATLEPRERDRALDARPQLAQERFVAGELIVQIHLHDLAHLPVGGRRREPLGAVRQSLTKPHAAAVVHRVAEGGPSQRARELREQMRRRRLVVPDVRAVAFAAAALIAAALEAVELAVRRAEAGLRDERREIRRGAVLHAGRQGALAHHGGECSRAFLEALQVRRHVLGRLLGVVEARAVVVADARAAFARRRGPAAAVGRAIREAPRDQEREIGAGARGDLTCEANRRDRTRIVGFGPERAVGGEVVPEVHGARPPPCPRPSAQHGDLTVAGAKHPEADVPRERMVGRQMRVVHQDAVELARVSQLVDAWIRSVAGHRAGQQRVLDRPGDRDACRRRRRVRHAVAKHGNRQARIVGFVRDERAERVERDLHRKAAIAEGDVRKRELAGERRRLQALQARRAAGAQAECALIRRREARLEDARERGAARAFDANRGEGVIRSVALVGPIEDLPVAQLAASAEADAAGADPAEGKCNLREVRAREHARIGDARGRRLAGGRGLARRMRRLR